MLLLESVWVRDSELASDPLSSWPIFLRVAFLDNYYRNIDRHADTVDLSSCEQMGTMLALCGVLV